MVMIDFSEKKSEGGELAGSPSVRLSFYAILGEVMGRVEYDCFPPEDRPFAMELCRCMAEVFAMRSDGMIRIDGAEQSVGVVQEIFGTISHEHLCYVMEKFRRIPYEVRNKKAYLRTALYNAAFETEADGENQMGMLFGGASGSEGKR